MRIFRLISPRWVLLMLLAAGLMAVTGCASQGDEPENQSERPWNSPGGWQNGSLPGGMMQNQGH